MTTMDGEGLPIRVVGAERSDDEHFIVEADRGFPAFFELESAIQSRARPGGTGRSENCRPSYL